VKADASKRALVIGLGNPLRGDDGIGPAVVRTLLRNGPAGIALIETDGHDLTELLTDEAFRRIVVVDAADLGRPAGAWIRTGCEALMGGAALPVGHTSGLVQALDLLAALGHSPPPITIFAVQPAKVGWGPGLSRAARRGVSAVAAAIRQELCLPQPSRRGRTVLRTEQDVRSLPCRVGTA
jgi:hydrogenase maturation protease